MAKKCAITGKSTQVGGRYATGVRATEFKPVGPVRRKANISRRRIFVPELGKTVILNVSAKGMKHVKKNGAYATLKKAGVI